MIFQEPLASLNPAYTIGRRICEAIRLHRSDKAALAQDHAAWLLCSVGLAETQRWARAYPHQLSGGIAQRAMIAMAVSCEPALLIADEPTTALDKVTEVQILDLLDELREQSRMSIPLITHDLRIVPERADDVAVMYASRIVETADSQSLLAEPLHPYTRLLLRAARPLEPAGPRKRTSLPLDLSTPTLAFSGCPFYSNCNQAVDRCLKPIPLPGETTTAAGHFTACWKS